MVTMAAQTTTSADTLLSAVHSLMCHRQGRETESFAKRAIESLVKKLTEKREELDSLILAIMTNGTHQSQCATIQRTLDGRLQVAGRKGFPHVIYARIWRWPDLHKNELKHIKSCKYAFDLKQESVCINPYHYERVISPGFDLSSLSLHHAATASTQVVDEYSSSASIPHSNHTQLTSKTQHLPSESLIHIPDSGLLATTHQPPLQHFLAPINTGTTEASSYRWPARRIMGDKSVGVHLDCSDTVDYFPTPHDSPAYQAVSPAYQAVSPAYQAVSPAYQAVSPAYQAVSPAQHVIHRLDMSPSSSSGMSTCSSPMSFQLPLNHGNLALDMQSRPAQNQTFQRHYHEASGTTWIDRTPPVYSHEPAYWNNGCQVQTHETMSQTHLSHQLAPEYWCKQTYFELDQQVGEIFKVPYSVKTITIDGYTDPSSIDRFCLGRLSNVNRTEISERARLHIGKGVQLDYIGDGDVWLRCLGNHSVFIQSFYLDRESGRPPGNAVHKIYPNAYVKIFDIKQCYHLMCKQVASEQAAGAAHAATVVEGITDSSFVGASLSASTGIAVDDLRKICLLRFSFVKGWGPDYHRKSIKDTPCWVEIQLHRPLQFLDEVLQSHNNIQPRPPLLLS